MGWYLSIVYTLLASHPLLVVESYIYGVLGLVVFYSCMTDFWLVFDFFVHNFSLYDCDTCARVFIRNWHHMHISHTSNKIFLTGVKSRANQSTLSSLCRLSVEGFS